VRRQVYTQGVDAPPLVFDTNVFVFAPIGELEALARRGLSLRVSEIAIMEALGQAYRKHQLGEACALDAFIKRARNVAPFLDASTPVALGGANLTQRIMAYVDGQPPAKKSEEWAAIINAHWQHLLRDGLTNQEWNQLGPIALRMLNEMDDYLFENAIRDDGGEESEDRIRLAGPRWAELSDEERRAAHRRYTNRIFSDAVAERLDAHVCTLMYRFYAGLTGGRTPKRNDGADLQLTIHIGEGSLLVTSDRKLVDLVDAAGTFQRPWVRRLNDLDHLPESLPWGESARDEAKRFVRM
jgi:hypothetical protein